MAQQYDIEAVRQKYIGTEIAEARNIRGFVGEVLTRNTPMMRVFEKCGYPVEWTPTGKTISLRIPFDRARDTWADSPQNSRRRRT